MKARSLFNRLCLGLLIAATAGLAQARPMNPPPAPSHDQQKMLASFSTAKIEKNISIGISRGQLTRSEVQVLNTKLAQLKATIRRVIRDNRITDQERRQVERQDAALKKQLTDFLNNRATANQRSDNSRYPRQQMR